MFQNSVSHSPLEMGVRQRNDMVKVNGMVRRHQVYQSLRGFLFNPPQPSWARPLSAVQAAPKLSRLVVRKHRRDAHLILAPRAIIGHHVPSRRSVESIKVKGYGGGGEWRWADEGPTRAQTCPRSLLRSSVDRTQ